jgi:hypothetical protein
LQHITPQKRAPGSEIPHDEEEFMLELEVRIAIAEELNKLLQDILPSMFADAFEQERSLKAIGETSKGKGPILEDIPESPILVDGETDKDDSRGCSYKTF